MSKLLTFVSRGEQVRQRGMDNYSRWKRITNGLEPFGPAERSRLFRRQAEDEAKDRSWVQRHHPLADGAVVLSFQTREPRLPTQHQARTDGDVSQRDDAMLARTKRAEAADTGQRLREMGYDDGPNGCKSC